MNDIIEMLQDLSETVPVPLELPTFEQLVEVEEQILISLPNDLKEYLLFASDVIYGSIEMVTASDPYSHTYLPEVTSYAWSIGMPREYIAICQQGDNFYCIDQEGNVRHFYKGRMVDIMWESLWDWIQDIWLKRK
ncbi:MULTISPECIES: SMI1/KNR4 family protein [unclassified Shewanella]|uniref:SMI1/KNR4 family protein n=1 Tax=unclassified Shewanella TaxID=196818 RepID=UPI000970D468|nr:MULTISPECIES: SMI1/KNR4 family protein [unclassified Shewanella]MDO6619753.1 SMI1/KNR4 family protein [Shewanella sp. 6_MG-2023]MDO6638683.1 SMI1/KNR4 family protein [Shewanella sp. 5_MG-2023]MDO6680186.1 SMI1/KNR4 family protein [Shewanella sp. 4_MG-2023]MDO6774157.1 SMI1/KNR4 family protein [Shewanella sp. 3_MG-2023]PMG32168.1 cell wall assembly protein [Shewanella sp. 10N.286.52.C2]